MWLRSNHGPDMGPAVAAARAGTSPLVDRTPRSFVSVRAIAPLLPRLDDPVDWLTLPLVDVALVAVVFIASWVRSHMRRDGWLWARED